MTYATDTTRRALWDQENGSIEERISNLENAIHEIADCLKEQWGEGSTDRRAYRHSANDARGAAYDAHPSIDGRNLRDCQKLLDQHFEQQRLDQLRPPLRGDALAGLRDAASFARRSDIA